MEAEERKCFEEYISATFPEGKKRTRSAVIHRNLSQRIIRHLKGNYDEDKTFRHYVKSLVSLYSIYLPLEFEMSW